MTGSKPASRPTKARLLFKKSVAFLAADKMPVWLTLVSLVLGVAATYILAPKINAKFESEKIRSAYVQDNLKTLNADTSELMALAGDYNRKLMNRKFRDEDLLSDIEKRITKLQWKVVEYDIIFPDKADKEVIRKYKIALEQARKSLVESKDLDGVGQAIKDLRVFSQSTHQMVRLLSEKMDIKITIDPTN